MRLLAVVLTLSLLAGCAGGTPRDGGSRELVVDGFTNHTLRQRAGNILADLFVAEAIARGWSVQTPEKGRAGAYRLTGAVTEFDYREAGSRGPALGFTARLIAIESGETVWAGSFTGSARGWTGRSLNGVATEVVNRALTGMARQLEARVDGSR